MRVYHSYGADEPYDTKAVAHTARIWLQLRKDGENALGAVGMNHFVLAVKKVLLKGSNRSLRDERD